MIIRTLQCLLHYPVAQDMYTCIAILTMKIGLIQLYRSKFHKRLPNILMIWGPPWSKFVKKYTTHPRTCVFWRTFEKKHAVHQVKPMKIYFSTIAYLNYSSFLQRNPMNLNSYNLHGDMQFYNTEILFSGNYLLFTIKSVKRGEA